MAGVWCNQSLFTILSQFGEVESGNMINKNIIKMGIKLKLPNTGKSTSLVFFFMFNLKAQ